MTLWEPGTLEGITPRVLRRVCKRAVFDHLTNDPQYSSDVPSDRMRICDVQSRLDGDNAFDRISHARWSDETFFYGSVRYRVTDWYGRNWTCVAETDGPVGSNVRAGDKLTTLGTEELARLLTTQNGPHPNPYVALVEVQYSSRGWRAGYGIRADGTPELFYN